MLTGSSTLPAATTMVTGQLITTLTTFTTVIEIAIQLTINVIIKWLISTITQLFKLTGINFVM